MGREMKKKSKRKKKKWKGKALSTYLKGEKGGDKSYPPSRGINMAQEEIQRMDEYKRPYLIIIIV